MAGLFDQRQEELSEALEELGWSRHEYKTRSGLPGIVWKNPLGVNFEERAALQWAEAYLESLGKGTKNVRDEDPRHPDGELHADGG